MRLWLEKIHLDLKVNWKLSRNQTTFKENFIVHLEKDQNNYRSEIAPNIRYGESPDAILRQFNDWLSLVDIKEISDVKNLEEALDKVQLFHSLRFGLESVFLSLLTHQAGKTIGNFLGLPPVRVMPTSFSMPIIPVNEIEDYLRPLTRFQSLKIKVNAETATEMLDEISRYTNAKLRVDANEGWQDLDEFMRFHEKLKGKNIELIEQPFPSSLVNEYIELKKKTPYVVLADESIEDVGNFDSLEKQFHAINIKLMKTGSLIKARNLIMEARAHKMQSMIGCMIETSIGISYGMLFTGLAEYVDLDGFLLIKDEPFHLVEEAEGKLKLN